MAFALAGGVITQTGDDGNTTATDLQTRGLDTLNTDVPTVTRTFDGNVAVYTLPDGVEFLVNGTLTINPEIERLVTVDQQAVRVGATGRLNLGKELTKNGFTRNSKGVAIYFNNAPSNWFGLGAGSNNAQRLGSATNFQVLSGGELFWRGAEIRGPVSFGAVAGSSVRIIDGIMTVYDAEEMTTDPTTGNVVASGAGLYEQGGSTLDPGRGFISWINTTDIAVDGLTVCNGGEVAFVLTPTGTNTLDTTAQNGIRGYSPINTVLGAFPNRTNSQTFVNSSIGGNGNFIDVTIQSEADIGTTGGPNGSRLVPTETFLVNERAGTDLIINAAQTGTLDGRSYGRVLIQRDFNIDASSLADNNAVINGGRFFIRDSNHGFRTNLNNRDDTDDNIYSDVLATNVVASDSRILLGAVKLSGANSRGTTVPVNSPVMGNPYAIDLRGKTNDIGADLFDVHYWHPEYQYFSQEVDMSDGTVGTLQLRAGLAIDTNYQTADFATANKIETLDELYKVEKDRKIDPSTVGTPAGIELPTIGTTYVTASDSALDLGTLNLVNNPSAATRYVATATQLTISADSLTSGTTFDSVETSGTVNNGGLALDYGVTATTLLGLPTTGEIITVNGSVGGSTDINLSPGDYTIAGDASGALFDRVGSTGTVTLTFLAGSTRPTAANALGTGVEAPYNVVINSVAHPGGRLSVYRNGVLVNTAPADQNPTVFNTTATVAGTDDFVVVYTAPGRTDFRGVLDNVSNESSLDVVTQVQDVPPLGTDTENPPTQAQALSALSLRETTPAGQLIVDVDGTNGVHVLMFTALNYALQHTVKGTEAYNNIIRIDAGAVDALRSLGNASSPEVNGNYITFESTSAVNIGYVVPIIGAPPLASRTPGLFFRPSDTIRVTGTWTYSSNQVADANTGMFSYDSSAFMQFTIHDTDAGTPPTDRSAMLSTAVIGDYITITDPNEGDAVIAQGLIAARTGPGNVVNVSLLENPPGISSLVAGTDYTITISDSAGEESVIGVEINLQPAFDPGVTEAQLRFFLGNNSDVNNRLSFIGQGRNSVLPAGETYDPDVKY